jgi:hypothetical protein
MKRHVAAPVVAVLAAGLLATACSGDGGSSDDDIPGAGGTETQPENGDNESDPGPEDEDSEAGDDGIDRPEIVLPDDVINVFEEVDTDDPVELAVLADQERYINAVDEAITSGDIDGSALRFYASGEALRNGFEFISGMHEDNLTFAGTTRYYNREVTVREEDMATTAYCVDASESYTVDTETGEQDPDVGNKYLYASRLERNEAGVWQTVDYTVDDGDSACR